MDLTFELQGADTIAGKNIALLQGFATTAFNAMATLQDKGQNTVFALHRPSKGSGAKALRTQLHAVTAHDALGHSVDTPQYNAFEDDHWMPRMATHIGGYLQPQGDTHNDNDPVQRVLNIVTSLPLIGLGAHSLATRRTTEGRNHALSLLVVGGVATAYHASSGNARRVLRKLDYWCISLSSAMMGKALWPERSWKRRCLNLSMLAIPFKPFLVSTGHILAMQAEFAKEASQHQHVARDFKKHLASAALGAAAFALEDPLAERGFDHTHSIWHLLAAYGVAQMCKLVDHKESMRLMEVDVIKPLRSCHDSVGSLTGLETGSWRAPSSKQTP